MFCTGGIRCEKSTSFLRAEGVEEVYHLKGGILKYLEEVPAEHSLWQGECFVFDARVSLGHGLAQGTHTRCQPCGRPVRVGEQCQVCEPSASPLQSGAGREIGARCQPLPEGID